MPTPELNLDVLDVAPLDDADLHHTDGGVIFMVYLAGAAVYYIADYITNYHLD